MDQAHDDGPTARLPVADSTVSVSPEAAPRFSPGAGPEDSPQANPQPSPAPRPLPDTARRVLVMAIVNRTRDSFFDEGRTWDLDAAVLAGRERSEEHTSELQSRGHLVCRLLLAKKNSQLLFTLVH